MTIIAALQTLLFENKNSRVDELKSVLDTGKSLQGNEARNFVVASLGYCRILYEAERINEALEIVNVSVKLAEILDELPLKVRAYIAHGNILAKADSISEAMRVYLRVLRLVKDTNDKREIVNTLRNIASLYYFAALPAIGVVLFQKIVYGELSTVDREITQQAAAYLAQCYLSLGEIGKGIKAIQIANHLKGHTNHYRISITNKTYVRLLCLSGRLDEAEKIVRETTPILDQNPPARVRIEVLVAQGSFEMASGRIAAGKQLLLEALDYSYEIKHEPFYVLLALTQGLAQAGYTKEAEAYALQMAKGIASNIDSLQRVKITEEEHQLLKLIDQGMCFKKIAQIMGKDDAYWRTKSSRLYKKLGVKNKTQASSVLNEVDESCAVQIALEEGLEVALGSRIQHLPSSTQAIMQSKSPLDQFSAVECIRLDSLALAFNIFRQQGDKSSAGKIAKKINKEIELTEQMAMAWAEITTLAYAL